MNERWSHRLGWTEDGERVEIEASVNTTTMQQQSTTSHQVVDSPLRFSISGTVYDRRTWVEGGQIDNTLPRIVKPAPGWTLEEIAALHEMWQRWHLNDMRAGCAHQVVVYEDHEYGRRPSLDLTRPCPETGYKYGHAWLVEPLSDHAIERIRFLLRERV